MTHTDPEAGKAFFQTNDQPTQANFYVYLLDNLLSLDHYVDVQTGDLDIVSTAAETTLYSVTIPANTLGTTGCIGLTLWGDFLFNNAAGNTITPRVKFGGVTSIAAAYIPYNSGGLSASRFPWYMRILVANRGATNAQLITYEAGYQGGGTNAYSTGIGLVDTGQRYTMGQNTAAIDTTVDQTLLISLQWSASSANNSWRRRWARTQLGRN